MNKRKLLSIISLLIVIVAYFINQRENKASSVFVSSGDIVSVSDFNFYPTSTTGQIIHHNGYSLSYNEEHEQAEWVAYSLSINDISYTNRKRPFFIEDPKVRSKSADWRNYKKSGYDKGHLCPAGDRRATKKLYDETFYTSNVSPQNHDFNSGIWNLLEQKTRYWAKKYKHLYVVTGGILTEKSLKKIGKEKVSVPNTFYKILLDYTEPEIKAIAFLLPHKESNRPLYEFVVSIDELEEKTNIDFFPELPDNIETKLEASSNYKNWSFR
ncbi:DNA/RNA non-specific endonuclease [Tenacibaculum sp. IB213877]|nr:DNA/RNA non-specific endonuclease [Tenacibaculum sp. IB213877]MDY0780760.1 DNA/RNA non-specific endonuclease [Tenacibaculum sp. IB213877]